MSYPQPAPNAPPVLHPNPLLTANSFLNKFKTKPCRSFRKYYVPRVKHATPKPTVINLSSFNLSTGETSLLSKGLNFCPTPTVNFASLQSDLSSFCRRLNIQQLYGPPSSPPPKFHPKSNWHPKTTKESIANYHSTIESTILHRYSHLNHIVPNITVRERKAIQSLTHNTDIVIKSADKGSAVVIMNKSDYLSEVHRQLSNRLHYKPLIFDPTPLSSIEITSYLKSLADNKIITPSLFRYLKPPNPPRTPQFYLLPKIHKQNNPGRPILSANSCPTERISEFVDYFLQPLVNALPSHIKDTPHFIDSISSLPPLSPDVILVSLDVKGLYTNIPQNEGLFCMKQALDLDFSSHPSPCRPPIDVLMELAKFVLTQNFFLFDGRPFHQTHGTAMGTRMAPSFANLFMGNFESRFLNTCPLKPLLWKRFIDDIFMIWPHSYSTLHQFLNSLNRFHPSIKFSFALSHKSVTFLDVVVFKDKMFPNSGKLSFDLHTKSTDTHQYLDFTSAHPLHCKRSIPLSQTIRIKRLVSHPARRHHHLRNLAYHLVLRGYDSETISSQINKGLTMNSNTSAIPQNHFSRTPLVITYSPSLSFIPSLLHRHFSILTDDPTTQPNFPLPPLTSFRRPSNLKDILTHSTFKSDTTIKTIHSNPRCKCCPHLTVPRTIKSSSNNSSYPTDQSLSCRSYNVIYFITCLTCRKQYVGETSLPLHVRLQQHRYNYLHKRPSTLSSHFNSQGHPDTPSFTISPVTQISNPFERKKLERSLMKLLGTVYPIGINGHPTC